jgi:L-ascorbate oxidase
LVLIYTEVIEDGEPRLLRWAINNISNIRGSEPIIESVVLLAKEVGWPSSVPETEAVPLDPPFVWNYTELVNSTGGPGPALGSQAQAVVQFEEGEIFEFVLQNTRAINGAAEVHPWHAHGHSFWIVGRGEGIYDPEVHVDTYNLKNPLLRDTVTVYPLNWVAIRFVANNPGAWLFHCHILSHQVMGMGFVMLVQPDMLEDSSDSVRNCNDQGLAPGDGDGNVTTGDPTSSAALWFSTTIMTTVLSLPLAMLW